MTVILQESIETSSMISRFTASEMATTRLALQSGKRIQTSRYNQRRMPLVRLRVPQSWIVTTVFEGGKNIAR